MFLVVSRWEAIDGKEAEFDAVSLKMSALLRKQPGVEMVEVIKNGPHHIAVHGYRDQAAYQVTIDDPQGIFTRAAEENGIDSVARWLGSERGETMPHA